MARSQPYGLPLWPRVMATSQATMSATSRTDPATAVACRSICAKRSSRPSPRSPRTVSLRPASRKNRPNAVRPTREPTPTPGCPPSQVTARMIRPRTSENVGRNHLERVIPRLRTLVIEHLLDRDTKIPGESERQRKRWGITLVLDRVDGLARHPHRLCQLALGQVLPHPHVAHRVLHARGTAQRAVSRRRGRQRRPDPGQTATTTAGSHAIEVTGAQLPCLIACATEAAATNTATRPATTYSHRFEDFMTDPLSVKRTCHRQASLTPSPCQARLSSRRHRDRAPGPRSPAHRDSPPRNRDDASH